MDKVDIITENKSRISNYVVDGVIYGLMGGIAMYVFLAVMAIVSGDTLTTSLARFSADGWTSPVNGLISHLAVSAIYGTLFGALVWLVTTRFSTRKLNGWIAGLAYGGFLFLLAQMAILPITNSPLGEIPAWHWGFGHAIYGLALGGLFSKKMG